MKGKKEYPATHSMSTAWYAADEEGNVAIIDYNENGPVPWEYEQTSIEELVFGHDELDKFIRINLTKEQIFELLEDSDRNYGLYSVIQIDNAQKQSFKKRMKDAKVSCVLISEEEGLFLIDRYDFENAFPKMMWSNRIYNVKDFDIDEEYKDGKIAFKGNFQSAPYFIYAQPYNPDFLTERLNIPDNPVKLDQFPEPFRQRVPILPVRFRDSQKLQIAEWIPCSFSNGEAKCLNGCEYGGMLPKTDGEEVYMLMGMNDIDFFPYCSEKEKYHCTACTSNYRDNTCPNAMESTFTHKPTVMMIVSPFRKKDYKYNTCTDIITIHSIILPYLPKIPKPLYDRYFSHEIKDEVSQQEMDRYLGKCRRYLDDMVARYRPRVIIIGEDAYKGLKKVYAMDKNSIEIGNEGYPFYRENDIETHRKEIERLAMLPYRGTEFPIVVSKEEMERIGKDRKGRYD